MVQVIGKKTIRYVMEKGNLRYNSRCLFATDQFQPYPSIPTVEKTLWLRTTDTVVSDFHGNGVDQLLKLIYFVNSLVKFGLPLSEAKISGGLLPNKYKLVGFHLHWGSKKGRGSEHKVSKISYDAEVNICFMYTFPVSCVNFALIVRDFKNDSSSKLVNSIDSKR